MNDQEFMRFATLYLENAIDDKDLELLNRELSNSPDRVRQFNDLRLLTGLIHEHGQSVEEPKLRPPEPIPPLPVVASSYVNRTGLAAALGLAIGVLMTCAVWAATKPSLPEILTLLHESFESGPPPDVTGFPVEPEVWSGDFSEVVTEHEGVTPYDGTHMLRFLRTDFDGKSSPVGRRADVHRVVDLHSLGSVLATNEAVVSVESVFRSLPFNEAERHQCQISVYALSELPGTPVEWREVHDKKGGLADVILASSRRKLRLSPSGIGWRKCGAELRVSADARFLYLGFHIMDKSAAPGDEPPAVAIEGQFLDDVRVTLARRTSLQ
jgi:hypothetical protein